MSNLSVTKDVYVQKELRKVLNIALEKPEETIFIISARLALRGLFPDRAQGMGVPATIGVSAAPSQPVCAAGLASY